MKVTKFSLLFLTALCLHLTPHSSLLSPPLYAQWLETTIYVPDSLSGISFPQAFTYNAENNKVYVGGYYGDGVIVIDGETDEKIARIQTGSGIYALCWNPTNNKVYCANEYSYNVTIIDGATNSVITTVTVGSRPCALVYNPTNNKIYSNRGSYNVTIIDGATNSVITTITVGDQPCAFTYNPQQNRVYVANYFSSSISVIRDEIPGIEEIVSPNRVAMTNFEIYPNPAKSVLRVRFQPPFDSPFIKGGKGDLIKIFDASGTLIKEIATPPSVFASQSISTGSALRNDNEVKISLKGINPGIYFIQLRKETKKLLVVK
jgi:YVTN family beta-propeller protein